MRHPPHQPVTQAPHSQILMSHQKLKSVRPSQLRQPSTQMKMGTSCLWTRPGELVELITPGLAMTHPRLPSQTPVPPLPDQMSAWLTPRGSAQSLGELRDYEKRRRCRGDWGAGPPAEPSQHLLQGVWIFGERGHLLLVKGLQIEHLGSYPAELQARSPQQKKRMDTVPCPKA